MTKCLVSDSTKISTGNQGTPPDRLVAIREAAPAITHQAFALREETDRHRAARVVLSSWPHGLAKETIILPVLARGWGLGLYLCSVYAIVCAATATSMYP